MKGVLRGTFNPVNTNKYIGKYPIVYRSSWELTVMRMCDSNPNIIEWASESLKIPYINPLTNRSTVYVPDFAVVLETNQGQRKMEIWEIKPKKESMMEYSKTDKNRAALAVNAAKWQAATAWCQRMGATFRVITEDMLFRNHKR